MMSFLYVAIICLKYHVTIYKNIKHNCTYVYELNLIHMKYRHDNRIVNTVI